MKKSQAKPNGKARRRAVENMPTKSVRLNQETQGTVAGEGHRTMVKLPEGSEIALVVRVGRFARRSTEPVQFP